MTYPEKGTWDLSDGLEAVDWLAIARPRVVRRCAGRSSYLEFDIGGLRDKSRNFADRRRDGA
jgi:hypothetical protein